MKCPLKEAVRLAKADYMDDPEKVGQLLISIVCEVCGHSVNATVSREIPRKKVTVSSDSCQNKNPPAII